MTMHSSSRLLYHLLAFTVVAIWGSTFVFTKLLLVGGLSAAQIFVLRFIIAYVLLLCLCLCRGIRWLSRSWRDELLMAALGLTGGSLYFLTENSAMLYTTTTNTSLIVCLCPLFASALIGVMNGHFVLHLSPLGDALALAACLSWAFYSLLMIPANARYDTLFITRKVFFYGLLTMIPYFILRPGLGLDVLAGRPELIVNLLFLGCIASMLCFVAWNWVLKKLGPVVATNYVYFNPVTTILFAWAILHEQITLYFVLGTILILAGLYLTDHKASPPTK